MDALIRACAVFARFAIPASFRAVGRWLQVRRCGARRSSLSAGAALTLAVESAEPDADSPAGEISGRWQKVVVHLLRLVFRRRVWAAFGAHLKRYEALKGY